MNKVQNTFIELVKNTVLDGQKNSIPVSDEVVSLAAMHDMLHLVRNNSPDNYFAAIRAMQMEYVLDRVRSALKNACILFVPMKGAVIRYMYPQPWMRSCSDIDILVRKENLKEAIGVLADVGFETDEIEGAHDIKVFLSDVSVELHFMLDYLDDQTLYKAWDYAERIEGDECDVTVKRVALAVDFACSNVPWESMCMVRALTAARMLGRRGYPFTLYMGLMKDPDGNLIAHAWLRVGSFYVTGGNGSGYTVTAFYSNESGVKEI